MNYLLGIRKTIVKAIQEATESHHYGKTLWAGRVDSIEKD